MASFPVNEVKEGDWTSGVYYDILGVNISAVFANDPALLADFITNFQTRPDDVFIVTYPKSGTTWVQEIVWQIHNEGRISSEKLIARVPFLETATNERFSGRLDLYNNCLPSPRMMKTHLPYSTIPKCTDDEAQCKYIYIARNPKDVAVSYFLFNGYNWTADGTSFSGPWEFFVKLFIEGKMGWNFWNDHVLGWWKHRDDPNVLFLKYEDLLKDSPSHVRMIAEFLNKPLSDELINRIAEQCSLKGMSKNARSFKYREEEDGSSPFLRKGVVGDWKNHFTPELNEIFEKEVLAKLEGSGLEFEFEI